MSKNLKRNIHIGFRVTEEEQEAIKKRMEIAGIKNLRSYFFHMVVNCPVFNIDLAEVRECSRLLRILGNNVNQLAKKANEGGNIYAADIEDIQTRLGEIWEQQDKTIKSITKILEVTSCRI